MSHETSEPYMVALVAKNDVECVRWFDGTENPDQEWRRVILDELAEGAEPGPVTWTVFSTHVQGSFGEPAAPVIDDPVVLLAALVVARTTASVEEAAAAIRVDPAVVMAAVLDLG